MNKFVFDADIAILIGHTQGNPYGGYSGGYKHCVTGISHWNIISAHHIPRVMHRDDFVPVSTNSLNRDRFNQQGKFMEEKMGKKFFCCDAVLDTKSRQIAIYSGYAKELQPISWELANSVPMSTGQRRSTMWWFLADPPISIAGTVWASIPSR